jgi:hypothetical protein
VASLADKERCSAGSHTTLQVRISSSVLRTTERPRCMVEALRCRPTHVLLASLLLIAACARPVEEPSAADSAPPPSEVVEDWQASGNGGCHHHLVEAMAGDRHRP